MIWKILEIEKTKDEEIIKNAYREKLRDVNPEDDQEGFMELRKAYEEAMQYAAVEENDSLHNVDEEQPAFKGKKNDVDLWIDKVDHIYQDVKTRIDEFKWNELLKDSVCDNLDTELEAGEKLLAYFMSHANMPQNIWQLVDKRFGYIENMESLKEKFPENYLEYIKWQIKRPGFIDYTLFDGETNQDVDAYINKLYEAKTVIEDRDIPRAQQLIKELKRFDVTHPFTETEEAHLFMVEAELLEEALARDTEQPEEELRDKKRQLLEDALAIMENLEFEYSQNPYIERIYAESLIENGKIVQAKAVYEGLLEQDEVNYMAMLGKARCIFLEGDAEEAKEQIEDVLEDRVQDVDALNLLEKVNKVLVEKYEVELKKEMVPDTCYKLGWCYYQQKRFEEGIRLLDKLDHTEEYDYINLRCRLYLANDDYKQAQPWAQKWLELIEASEDDGSKEMKKRKNRLSLAHFSLGICAWENEFKLAEDEAREEAISKVESYLEQAIAEETNLMVRFSYMEQMARFYLDAKEYEKCIEKCDAILEKDRGFFPAYVHRQKAHHELRNAKEVVDDYYACIEIYPAYAPPYVLAAEVFYAFDQYDDVEQVIAAAEEAGLESHALELYKIRCVHYKEFSEENTKKALDMLVKLRDKVKALGKDETDIEDFAELEKEYAILHWDLDQTDTTLFIVDTFLQENPDNITMLHLKADILMREGKAEEALQIYIQLGKLEPDNLHIRTKKGNCYERMDKIQVAIRCYEGILEENPDYVPAIRRMMYIYSYLSNRKNSMGKCKKAIEYATRFIELTNAAEGYVERGNLYIDLYELEKSVEDCKKAIELDEDAYYAYNNLGCALLKLRRENEAIEPLKHAIIMAPTKDILPYLNLAECYVLQESYGKAIETYESALKLRPDDKGLRKDIAKIYCRMGQYQNALEIYQQMVDAVWKEVKKLELLERVKFHFSVNPSEKETALMLLYCDIADVYRQAGDIEKAEAYFNKIYSTGRKMFKHYSANVTEKVAEYYRDSGQAKKALWILNHTLNEKLPADEVNTWEEHHLAFTLATIYLELGEKFCAKQYAMSFLDELLKKNGGEEKMLSDRRYLPMHLYDMGIMYVCAGELEKAKAYLEQIPECKLCVMCETCNCFEYFFGMGLIAELEGRKEDAVALYKRAIAIKGDYPCAQHHLEKLLAEE